MQIITAIKLHVKVHLDHKVKKFAWPDHYLASQVWKVPSYHQQTKKKNAKLKIKTKFDQFFEKYNFKQY